MNEAELEDLKNRVVSLSNILFFQDQHSDVKYAISSEENQFRSLLDENGNPIRSLSNLKEMAEKVARKRAIKSAICASIKSVTGDLSEIARIVTVAMVPLAITKTIEIPLNELLFAAVSLVVYKSGVAAYCDIQSDKSLRE